MYMQFLKNSNDKGEHEDKRKSYEYKREECVLAKGSNGYASNNEKTIPTNFNGGSIHQ